MEKKIEMETVHKDLTAELMELIGTLTLEERKELLSLWKGMKRNERISE